MDIPARPTQRLLFPVWALGASILLLTGSVFAQEAAVDDETCLACHDDYELSVADSPHRLGSQTSQPDVQIGCISCHSGGEVHAEDPSEDNISNPARLIGQEAGRACRKCHQPHRELDNYGFDTHADLELSCSECHRVHSVGGEELLDDRAEICLKCHVSMVNQFSQRSNHPTSGGEMGCLDCHDFTGQTALSFGHGGTANCYKCHPEHSGPYLYEHEAASSFSTEGGGGCSSCHNAHGSVNDRLLQQSANNLCRQCHGQPPLHRVTHNGVGDKYGCIDCHSEIHGSNHNSHLLDPQLGSKIGSGPDGCYCHNVFE